MTAVPARMITFDSRMEPRRRGRRQDCTTPQEEECGVEFGINLFDVPVCVIIIIINMSIKKCTGAASLISQTFFFKYTV